METEKAYEILCFKECGDDRGHLVAIEGNDDIPFDIKRIFYIYGSSSDIIRGQHANVNTEFVLVNVKGSCKIKIDDGINQSIIELNEPFKGVYLSPKVWKDMYDFSEDSVLLVLASTHYDTAEYINDYNEWKTQIMQS